MFLMFVNAIDFHYDDSGTVSELHLALDGGARSTRHSDYAVITFKQDYMGLSYFVDCDYKDINIIHLFAQRALDIFSGKMVVKEKNG
jgi:hypothetical protein